MQDGIQQAHEMEKAFMSPGEEGQLMMSELRRLRDELDAISAAGGRFEGTEDDEISEFHRRLRLLKDELKAAAKYETMDRKSRPKTDLEKWFFGPCVRQAASHFRMRVDAAPHNWRAGLCDSLLDFDWTIHNMEKGMADL